MTRILTYNIQTGGTHRIDQLTTIMRESGADVIGLTEATNPQVTGELAKRLGMHLRLSGQARHERDWQVGVLSRLPVVNTKIHSRPDIFARRYLLEVCLEEADGKQLTVFVVHLTSAFYKGAESERVRRGEVQEILRIIATRQGAPHVLMGDFNAITPGESIKAGMLLSYMLDPEQNYLKKYLSGRSELNFLTRSYLHILKAVPRNSFLSVVADTTSPLYAPRAGLERLHRAGYIDCYRHINPQKPGFTYPSRAPAGRIDYIFASPELAQRLSASYVVVKAAGVHGGEASDHLPLFAEFA